MYKTAVASGEYTLPRARNCGLISNTLDVSIIPMCQGEARGSRRTEEYCVPRGVSNGTCIYVYMYIHNSSGNVAYHAQVTRPITINNESATMKQDVYGVYI